MNTFRITIVAVFSCILTALPLAAQNTSIGLKAGRLWSNISNQPTTDNVWGFRLGGFITHSVTSEFGVGAELNFARKGGEINGGTQQVQLDYLEIPVIAQYFFGEGGFRPKVFAGPYVGYLLRGKTSEGTTADYNQNDYGIQAGLGFHYSLSNSRWLYMDVRYSHGFSELLPQTEQFNRDFSLNIGVSFPLDVK